MERATYHHGNLRAELLSAARALVREVGISGLSVAKLAKRAGVSPAAPYRHFADRDQLMAELAVDVGSALNASMQAAAEGAGDDPVARLAATAGGYTTFVLENGAGLELLFAQELRGPRFADVHVQSRALMDVMLTMAQQAHPRGAWGAWLGLLEAHLALAQGYASLQLLGALAMADLSHEQLASRATEASMHLIRGTVDAHAARAKAREASLMLQRDAMRKA